MDTTTSAIAKLIAKARERARAALTWIGDELSTGEDLANSNLALADTLEAVTRERDEWKDDAERHEGDVLEQLAAKNGLRAQLEAVTKERDALRERMDVALSALHEYAIRERDAGEVGDSVASDALAEIAALASRATPQEK